ncbi:aminotransferase class III-fold pyridoxal phosphate-dependent enzyme, partial [Streptomyces sp. NE06-03E]|uniref:aminotransferase class III-fold pyridoxal phosphate-dependent enzyme n=1 Tax=Streptomyces sp. NE06-03E TaxID=3028695 RepID=UPI0029B82629
FFSFFRGFGDFYKKQGREISEKLMDRGVLVKDTHGSTIRIAPPLVISKEDLDWGLDQLRGVLAG